MSNLARSLTAAKPRFSHSSFCVSNSVSTSPARMAHVLKGCIINACGHQHSHTPRTVNLIGFCELRQLCRKRQRQPEFLQAQPIQPHTTPVNYNPSSCKHTPYKPIPHQSIVSPCSFGRVNEPRASCVVAKKKIVCRTQTLC